MIIAICGLKGGVGKSTVALALASAWRRWSLRPLLVDLTPGGGTLSHWARVGLEAGLRPPITVRADGEGGRPTALAELARGFPVTLLDAPAADVSRTRAAMLAADHVLLPCGPAAPDVWGLARTLDLLREVLGQRPHLPHGVLPNQIDARTRDLAVLRATLFDRKIPRIPAALGRRVAHADALAAGALLHDIEPGGAAAREAEATAWSLLPPTRRRQTGARPALH